MTGERTELGGEIESALGEVLAHVRGETELPCRIVDDPAASRIVALRKRFRLSRQKFADRFGLDVRALQEWEQGCRVPDRAARVLLTVIDQDPEAEVRAARRGWRRRTGGSFPCVVSDAPAARGRVRAGALGDPRAERDALIAATAIVQGMTIVTRYLVDFNATERRLSIPVLGNDDNGWASHARLRRCRNRAIREMDRFGRTCQDIPGQELHPIR